MTSIPYDTMSTTSSKADSAITKCCFCIPLKTGCFVLAYFNMAINIFHTISLISLITYFAYVTHGFSYIDAPENISVDEQNYMDTVVKPYLHHIAYLMLFVLCVNLAWLILSTVCLVGLHKKRPGPIRVYVVFAFIRLLLHIVAFILMILKTSVSSTAIITYGIDLVLSMYFIFVYYTYACQLDRDRESNTKPANGYADNIAYIYPIKSDMKKHIII